MAKAVFRKGILLKENAPKHLSLSSLGSNLKWYIEAAFGSVRDYETLKNSFEKMGKLREFCSGR